MKSRVAVVVGEVEAWHRDKAGVDRLRKIWLFDGRRRDIFWSLVEWMEGAMNGWSRREKIGAS